MFSILVLLSILFSCGNPHITEPELVVQIPNVTVDPLREIIITNPDGGSNLNIVTSLPSKNGLVNLKNPNNEEIVLSYAFEKSEHFRFNGGAYPGDNGSCSLNSLPDAECNLDIEFFSNTMGVYTDTLTVTYSLKSSPNVLKRKIIPLRGERLTSNVQPLELSPVAAGTQMEFQTTSGPASAQLNQLNPNLDEVVVSHRFLKGQNFRYKGGVFPGTSGNCRLTQVAEDTCQIEIEFFSNSLGRFTDELIVTYALATTSEQTREVRMPLVGEKSAPLSSGITIRPLSGGTSINMGTANLGSALRTDKIFIENTGLTNQMIQMNLVSGGAFNLVNNCPATLIPQASCLVDVTYPSTTLGTHNDIVRIAHKASHSNQKITLVPVTGITTPATLRPGELILIGSEGGDIDFGTTETGTEVNRLIEIRNIGEASVTLASHLINGAAFTFTGGQYPGTRGTCGQVIHAGDCTLDLSFRSQIVGSYQGNLILIPTEGQRLVVNLEGIARTSQSEICYRIEERRVNPRSTARTDGLILPYLSQSPETVSKLSLFYGTTTNGRIESLNRKIVKNAQVYVSFDVPQITEEIVDVKLSVDVTKVILDGYRDTESLCLSMNGLRKCSGREFTLESWRALRNPNFWNQHIAPLNTIYEDEFSQGASRCGRYICYTMVKQLSNNELFELTNRERQQISGKALHYVFSDDTRLRTMPSLILKVKKPVACQ